MLLTGYLYLPKIDILKYKSTIWWYLEVRHFGGNGGRILMNRISPRIRRDSREMITLFGEHTEKDMVVCQPGSELSPGTESTGT